MALILGMSPNAVNKIYGDAPPFMDAPDVPALDGVAADRAGWHDRWRPEASRGLPSPVARRRAGQSCLAAAIASSKAALAWAPQSRRRYAAAASSGPATGCSTGTILKTDDPP